MINSDHQATPEATAVASRRTDLPERDTPSTATSGLLVAWAGFLFGTILSVAMNWLHTWIPPQGTPAGWTPGVAPQIMSAVWPLCLLLAVEVLSRVPWRHGFAWAFARYGGVGTVAAGSAVISYGHVHDVLASWGYNTAGAIMGPLVIDGLMIACGFAMLSTPNTKTVKADTSKPNCDPSPAVAAPTSCDNPSDASDTPTATTATPALETATPRDTQGDTGRDTTIRALAQNGASTREIGRRYGLHHSTVARILTQPDTRATIGSSKSTANGRKT